MFFREVKDLAGWDFIPHFWLSKSDVREVVQRPKVVRAMNSLQYYDKVNCNCAGLLRINHLMEPCSWVIDRPSIYTWVEATFDVKCQNVSSFDCDEPNCT